MRRLVEFPPDRGGSILARLDEPPAGSVTRGLWTDRYAQVGKADQTFEDATAAVAPAARSLIAQLGSIDDSPDEIVIQLAVQLSAHTGAFVVSVAAQANCMVSMTWAAPRYRRRLSELP